MINVAPSGLDKFREGLLKEINSPAPQGRRAKSPTLQINAEYVQVNGDIVDEHGNWCGEYDDKMDMTFSSHDFILPDEEFDDSIGPEEHRAYLKHKLLKEGEVDPRHVKLTSLDDFVANGTLVNGSSTTKRILKLSDFKLKKNKEEYETKLELATIRKVQKSIKKKVKLQDEEPSTLLHPHLDSVEEKLEDLRQAEMETWCLKRGVIAAAKFPNKDKRLLRKWFKILDYDGSGEVNVQELQDPLLSSGIFKTREQVVRVLSNVDRNKTMGIDFEEFLLALHGNKLADTRKLKRLQNMGSNEYGFSTETLLHEERRNKLIHSIQKQSEKRSVSIYEAFNKTTSNFSNRRDKEKALKDLEQLESRQSVSTRLHGKYIDALEGVLIEKRERQTQFDIDLEQKILEKTYGDRPASPTALRYTSSTAKDIIKKINSSSFSIDGNVNDKSPEKEYQLPILRTNHLNNKIYAPVEKKNLYGQKY